jgi:hypothetical protein
MQKGLFSSDKNRLCFRTFQHSSRSILYGLDSGQIYTSGTANEATSQSIYKSNTFNTNTKWTEFNYIVIFPTSHNFQLIDNY